MASPLTSHTPLTWMPAKSPPTLTPKSPFTPAESVSAVPSKDSVFPPEGDLAGSYFPLTGMDEAVRQQLVDDHFLFVSGDPNLKVAGMERDWPEG